MEMEPAPFTPPARCRRRFLRSVGRCVCYLLISRQVRSSTQATSIAQCRAEFGSNRDILALGLTCRRFIKGDLSVNVENLSAAGTTFVRTCIDSTIPDIVYTATPPMATPTPSVTPLARRCTTRRFENIIGCACYLVLTRQVVSANRSTTIQRCRSVLGGNRFINMGALRCRKFTRRMNNGIFIRRLQFQKDLYVRTCLDADADPVEYAIPSAV